MWCQYLSVVNEMIEGVESKTADNTTKDKYFTQTDGLEDAKLTMEVRQETEMKRTESSIIHFDRFVWMLDFSGEKQPSVGAREST